MCRMDRQTEKKRERERDQHEESIWEDVLKLTTLHGNIREWMLHLSTPPACCHGDGLQGQQWGGSSFTVCVCVFKWEFVGDCVVSMCVCVCEFLNYYDNYRNIWYGFTQSVCVCECAYAHTVCLRCAWAPLLWAGLSMLKSPFQMTVSSTGRLLISIPS